MSGLDLTNYYVNLLITQYANLPKATAHIATLVAPLLIPQTSVQTLTFSATPTDGTFTLAWGGNITAAINWNDTVPTIQTKLRALAGLSGATVVGSIAPLALAVTFTGVIPPASLLTVASNTLTASSVPVGILQANTDVTIPLAVQDAFNITGSNLAVGVQLDVVGKYAGVTRNGAGLSGQLVTLDDADFV